MIKEYNWLIFHRKHHDNGWNGAYHEKVRRLEANRVPTAAQRNVIDSSMYVCLKLRLLSGMLVVALLDDAYRISAMVGLLRVDLYGIYESVRVVASIS